jgi:hypothetical protein
VYELEDNSGVGPDPILGQDVALSINLKLLPEDFERMNELVKEQTQEMLTNVDPDYYLFSFEDHELIDIIREPDKWSPFDKELAIRLLNERGIAVTKETEREFYDKRIKKLSLTEEASPVLIILGYLFAFCGGLIGLAIGVALFTLKKTLPNGNRIFVYTKNTRTHGIFIALIGVLMFLFLIYNRSDFAYHFGLKLRF